MGSIFWIALGFVLGGLFMPLTWKAWINAKVRQVVEWLAS